MITTIQLKTKTSISFIVMYFLNCLDLILTYTLINTSFFSELNPFLKQLIKYPFPCCFIKIFLVALLTGVLVHKTHTADTTSLFYLTITATLLILFYSLINLSHLYYISFFLY